MSQTRLHSALRVILEFGPVAGFVVAYLLLRGQTIVIAGTEYSGLVVVVGAFVPVFVLATAALWWLTGHVARVQIALAAFALVFSGLTLWLNDSTVFQMKPTVIYLTSALILGIGLMRGQGWLRHIAQDMIPLTDPGWLILSKRVALLCLLSGLANELVWRTQSETVWVLFETLAMPVLIVVFCLTQIGLVVDHATLKPRKKKPGKNR